MAKIKTSALVADIKGTVGGNVFASNKGGNYVRRGKKPTNANTEKQQAVRALFGGMTGNWSLLNDTERRTWIEGAQNFPYTDSLGEVKIYSGQQLFTKLNNNLVQYGLAQLSVCPVPQSFDALSWVVVSASVSAQGIQTLEAYFRIGAAEAVPANFVVSIAATAPMSAGISAPSRQRFKNIATLATGAPTVNADILTAYSSNFGALVPGETFYVSIMLVNTISGEASVMSDYKAFVLG